MDTKEYWKGNAPVLTKVDYNGESVMLPKVAPRDEPTVTVRKVILDRTVNTIESSRRIESKLVLASSVVQQPYG